MWGGDASVQFIADVSKIVRIGARIRTRRKSFGFFLCAGQALKTQVFSSKKSSYRHFLEKSTPTSCTGDPVTPATTGCQGEAVPSPKAVTGKPG